MQTSRPAPNRRIYLVRHAQCGESGTMLGAADPSLKPEGRAESANLAFRLRNQRIDRIVSSTLRRARETAEIIAAELRLTVELDPRLNEVSYGPWDGLTWAEIESRFPDAAARKLSDWFHFTPAGAEPFTAFFERVNQAWDSIRLHRARRTAIVAHRTVNAVLLARWQNPRLSLDNLRGSGGDRIYQFEQPHASYIVVGGSTLQQEPGE